MTINYIANDEKEIFIHSSIAQFFPVVIRVRKEIGHRRELWRIDDTELIEDDLAVCSDYTTKRERISIDFLYYLTGRLKMKSAIGVSFYNSKVEYSAKDVSNTTGVSLSKPLLQISQQALYDIAQWKIKKLQLNISPFIGLEYNQNLAKRKGETGYGDLDSEEADSWIENFKLPAISAETKMPAAMLSISGGLSAELIFLEKIGLVYEFGYSHALFGHSSIDVEYKYGSGISSDNFKSKDRGLLQSFGIRYYF